MKRASASHLVVSFGSWLFLLIGVLKPEGIGAALPEVIYLGVVDSKQADGQQVTLRTERCFFGNTTECSHVLTGAAPSDDAWAGIAVGDYIEARCFGGPGDAPGSWLFLARLYSRADPVITDAYGDASYTHSPWLGGFRIRHRNVPDCATCPEPELICATLHAEVTIDSGTYDLPPGTSATHADGRYEVDVVFNAGDSRPWPDCRPNDGWGGPQLVSDFTIHVRSTGGVAFRRGDCNADSAVNITDGIFVLSHLFLGGGLPPCQDSTDVDDNGAVEISDAVLLFDYLFRGGEAPAAPFASCGGDPTGDALICSEFPPCETS
jgi:hypothetical protein